MTPAEWLIGLGVTLMAAVSLFGVGWLAGLTWALTRYHRPPG